LKHVWGGGTVFSPTESANFKEKQLMLTTTEGSTDTKCSVDVGMNLRTDDAETTLSLVTFCQCPEIHSGS